MQTVLLIVLGGALYAKGSGYSERSEGVAEVIQIVLLGLIGTFVTRYRLRMIIGLLPMAIAAYILGGLRVNMIAVTLVVYLIVIEQRTKHLFFVILMVYLSVKSIPFVYNILKNGNGFNGYLF